jgi:hypothetical protein
MGTITFTGGSTLEQSLIQAGHTALATGLVAALAAAPSGGATFSTWFGDASAASIANVTGILTIIQTTLAGDDFAYDLTIAVEDAAYLPIVVSIASVNGSQISLVVSPSLWTGYDQTGATTAIAMSLCQQLCANFGGAAVFDRWNVTDPYRIQSMAASSPATAQSAPFAYMYYVGQYLTPPG